MCGSRALARTSGGSVPNDAETCWSARRMPEPGAGHGDEGVLAVDAAQVVLAVAQEREVVVGQPAQQLPGLGDLLVGDSGGGIGREVVGDAQSGLAHLRPVLDGLAYVAEHPPQRRLERSCLARALTRSISTCIHDSRATWSPVGVALGVGVLGSRTSSRSPVIVRRTSSCGWTTRWMPGTAWLIALVTESTRNGMSSVTTSTTVWPAAQPSPTGRG